MLIEFGIHQRLESLVSADWTQIEVSRPSPHEPKPWLKFKMLSREEWAISGFIFNIDFRKTKTQDEKTQNSR